MMNIFKDKAFVEKLNFDLNNGAVICFVTDTVWGIGALPTSKKGVEKIYTSKKRDPNKPLILMSNDVKNLLPYTDELSPLAKSLIKRYFAGALTLVTKKSEKTPDFVTAKFDTVGIRVPDNEFFIALCQNIEGGVLATTSANLSNEPSAKNYQQACEILKNSVDYIFPDCGYECKGLESTVVLINQNDYKILRQGAIQL